MTPIRLTIVETHPVQYNAPWYRHLTRQCPQIDLTVVYASRPTPEQQAVGFSEAFEWDLPLLQDYASRIVRESRPGDSFTSDTPRGLDVPEIGDAILETKPDVAMIAGWHSITQLRAIAACRRCRVPILYRGDTHLGLGPRGLRNPLWRLKTRALLHRYAAHLAVGQRARQYLRAHGVSPTRIYASPHAVDNDFFAEAAAPHLVEPERASVRRALGLDADEFVVLFVGKLARRKRLADALRAVARLPCAALLVVGDGEERDESHEEARRLGVKAIWTGFLNQRQIGRAYAAADCLVLPSESESWGLVVNEAMATGLPAVVSDAAGCAPDLIASGETGEIFRCGDIADLAAALGRVRQRGGRLQMGDACRARVAGHSYERAALGLVAACEAVAPRRVEPRILACCGGMVLVSGLERMTFEVLRVARERGASVHCIVNDWENHRIVPLAEGIGASWSTGYNRSVFTTSTLNPKRHLEALWDVLRTSAGLLLDAARFRPTHVLVPDHAAVLRHAPVLALLRLCGVRVVFRMANAPDRGHAHDFLWRRVLPLFVSIFVPNSRFSRARLQETGLPPEKITLIRNALSRRAVSPHTDDDVVRLAERRRTLLTVGQILPFKGTHLAVTAALRLLAEGHDVQAIIVGEIPRWPPELVDYLRDLQECIAHADAGDRVHFVGRRENVAAIMRASYVLSAPIVGEESFGNVVLEARSAGLPAVTFDRGGLTELVRHRETGYLCPTSDLDGLLEGLRYYVTQPVERARASANSLAVTASPENDCASGEFERRWWAMFDRAAGAGA